MRYTGLKYILDSLNFDINEVKAAFDFQENQLPSINVLPNFWATNSASGKLNNLGQFFSYPGSGFFNGDTKMELNKSLNLGDNSTMLFSYQKLRQGNEILISSITGNSFNNYSGFCIGINDANKLYFKYWNPVEGPFTFLYQNILADKNLIIINKIGPVISIGRLNNNTFDFELENFQIKNDAFAENNKIFLGGHSTNYSNWASGNNFSGFIDQFYLINDIPVFYNNLLFSGMVSNISLVPTVETVCFDTGVWVESGYTYLAPTGIQLQPVVTTEQRITGYQNIVTGSSYSGITGYQKIILGTGIDNCGVQKELYYEIPLSGLISNQYTVQLPLYGNVNITGYNQIELSGLVSGITGYFSGTQECEQVTGELQETTTINTNYLKGLSFSEVCLLKDFDKNKGDILEVFVEPYTPKQLLYNTDVIFDRINLNFNTILDIEENISLFANGQLLINSGFNTAQEGYETFIIPNVDYIITGDRIETNRFFVEEDFLFYDVFSGGSEWFKNTGNVFPQPSFNQYFTFRNGQKLLSGKNDFLFQNSIPGRASSMSLNKDGSILVAGQPILNGIVRIYSRDFINNTWILKQLISGTGNNQGFGTRVLINNDSNILLINSTSFPTITPSSIDIYTGNINNGWTHKQTISGVSGYTMGASSFGGSALDINDNSTVIAIGATSNSLTTPGFVQILTGNINNGWQVKQNITGTNITGIFGSSLSLNGSGNILAVGSEKRNFTFNEQGFVEIFTGNLINNWILKQTLQGGFDVDDCFGQNAKLNKSGNILYVGSNDYIAIYTGNLTSNWTSKTFVFPPFIVRDLSISDNGNYILAATDVNGFSNQTSIFEGDIVNNWSGIKTFNSIGFGIFSVINGNGDLIARNNFPNNSIDFYSLSRYNQFQEGDYILYKEIPSNLISITGTETSFININNSFNNGCSQVYFNGIRQKINNNYIENSKFDFISGVFEENQNNYTIYNNVEEFFV